MIEYRGSPDRAQLEWQMRMYRRRMKRRPDAWGGDDPETDPDQKPEPINNTHIHNSPDDPEKENDNDQR